MANFGAKRAKRFKIRTQVIYGKRTRVGIVSPGIRRARRATPRAPQKGQYDTATG